MSPQRRWYYQHLEREREKHRQYSKSYVAAHREHYREYCRNYYQEYKKRLMNNEKPVINMDKGVPEKLNEDGVMLLIAAVIDLCRQDIRRWEKHIERGQVKTKYKDVSYENYITAKEYLERELPVWQEVYSHVF